MYCSLKYFDGDGSVAEKYKGQRDLDSLSKFVLEKLGADEEDEVEEEAADKVRNQTKLTCVHMSKLVTRSAFFKCCGMNSRGCIYICKYCLTGRSNA